MFCEFLICQYNKNHHDDQSQECSQFYYSTEFAQNERRIPHDRGGLTRGKSRSKIISNQIEVEINLEVSLNY